MGLLETCSVLESRCIKQDSGEKSPPAETVGGAPEAAGPRGQTRGPVFLFTASPGVEIRPGGVVMADLEENREEGLFFRSVRRDPWLIGAQQ